MNQPTERGLRQIVAVALALLYLPSCYQWTLESGTLHSIIADQPSELRVIRTDGTDIIVYDPEVEHDSVVDTRHPPGAIVWENGAARPYPRVAIAVSDVRQAQTKTLDAERTAMAVGGVVAVGLAVFALVALNQFSNDLQRASDCLGGGICN